MHSSGPGSSCRHSTADFTAQPRETRLVLSAMRTRSKNLGRVRQNTSWPISSASRQYASLRPKIGLLVIHFPLVKSGNVTGELPVAIEASDNGEIAIQAAAS